MKSKILGTLLLILVPCLGWAQKPQDSWENLSQLRAGQKIEVVDMNLKSYKGTFVGASEEAISLRVRDQEVAIERANVLRVSSREKSNRMRNTLIGLAIGAGAGVAAGAAAGAAYHEEGETGLFMLLTVPLGAGIGAGVGAALPAGHQTIYRAPSEPAQRTNRVPPGTAEHRFALALQTMYKGRDGCGIAGSACARQAATFDPLRNSALDGGGLRLGATATSVGQNGGACQARFSCRRHVAGA